MTWEEEVKNYLRCLDDMSDFLDGLDETAGLPGKVIDSCEELQRFFTELYAINRKVVDACEHFRKND